MLQTLGLDSSVSQKEVEKAYSKLAGKWNPDKFKDPVNKEQAMIKFIEIHISYTILLYIDEKRNKTSKNT